MANKNNNLIAYAMAFAEWILPKIDTDEIILFGSVARGEADKESDIDLFFDTRNEEEVKKKISSELKKFYKSDIYEKWHIQKIAKPIKCEVGELKKWKLKRSIISDGIILYGRYKSMPEKMRGYMYISMKPIKDIAKRNKIIRYIFGRKEKRYSTEGEAKLAGGKKLSALSFALPMEKAAPVIKYLQKEKVDISFFEFWTDSL